MTKNYTETPPLVFSSEISCAGETVPLRRGGFSVGWGDNSFAPRWRFCGLGRCFASLLAWVPRSFHLAGHLMTYLEYLSPFAIKFLRFLMLAGSQSVIRLSETPSSVRSAFLQFPRKKNDLSQDRSINSTYFHRTPPHTRMILCLNRLI